MGVTEAYETVLDAAKRYKGKKKWVYCGPNKLELYKALRIVEKRIKRMRDRLDGQRAHRAKLKTMERGMPAWLDKATR